MAGDVNFHPECFMCTTCKRFIEDGDEYTLEERNCLYWWVDFTFIIVRVVYFNKGIEIVLNYGNILIHLRSRAWLAQIVF